MKININIGEIMSKSWQIVWKFKVLWIFGILAGCGSNNGNQFNYNGGSGDGGELPEFLRPFQNMPPGQAAREFSNQYMGIIAGIILVLCVLWFFFYFLGVMGRIGLIKGANLADTGATSLTFGEIWTESTPYFWRMFGLNLLVGLPFFLLMVILIGGMAFAGFSALNNGLSNFELGSVFLGLLAVFLVTICILSLVMSIVGMIVEQAQNAIVLEDLGVLEGLSRGWSVFKSGLLSLILLLFILGAVSWIVSMLIAIPFIAMMVPLVIGFSTAGLEKITLPLIIAGGCFVIYLPVLLTVSGVLQAYTQSVWTLTYRRLTALMGPGLPAQTGFLAP